MSERRDYGRYGTRFMLANIPPFLIAMSAFWFVVREFDARGLTFWVAVGVFFGSLFVLVAMDAYRYRHFRCPECGETLPKPNWRKIKAGDSIYFCCSACDIEWHVGLRIPDD